MVKYTLIIADDEEISRKALALLIKKELPDIHILAQAENGSELITLVQKHRPDLAIVDVNMPGVNGIDAIDLLCARGSKTRFVINTAYEEFEYVQRALELKVDAYMLKPERRENTVATLRRLCAEIDRHRATDFSNRQMNALLANIQPVLESEILYSLFIGEASTESFKAYCEMHGYQFESGAVVVLLPVIGNSLKAQDKSEMRVAIHEAFGGSCTYLAAVTESSITLLIFAEPGSVSSQRGWLKDVLHVALDSLNRTLSVPLRAGVGGIYSAFEKMSDSYREGLLALAEHGEDSVMFYRSERELENYNLYSKAARTLTLAVLEGNQQRISTEATHQRKLVQGDRNAAMELWKWISRELEEQALMLPAVQAQLNYVASRLAERESYPNFMEVIREGICRIADLLNEAELLHDDGYVEKAMRYIEEHYAEDFSLDDVAQRIGVSSGYLSRLISMEKGKTFVECLTEARMRVATSLALETRLPIREIALRSGYRNTTYFCRVFKKYTGKTIGELRAELRTKSQ